MWKTRRMVLPASGASHWPRPLTNLKRSTPIFDWYDLPLDWMWAALTITLYISAWHLCPTLCTELCSTIGISWNKSVPQILFWNRNTHHCGAVPHFLPPAKKQLDFYLSFGMMDQEVSPFPIVCIKLTRTWVSPCPTEFTRSVNNAVPYVPTRTGIRQQHGISATRLVSWSADRPVSQKHSRRHLDSSSPFHLIN